MIASPPVLKEPMRSAAPPSVTSLVGGIVSDFQRLLEQQLTLARYELRHDLRMTCRATLFLAVGAGNALLAGIGLLFAIAWSVSWVFPQIPLGGSFGILGLILAAVAWGMINRGLREFDSLNLRLSDLSSAHDLPSAQENNDGR